MYINVPTASPHIIREKICNMGLYIILPGHPFISLLLSLNFVIAITDLILVMDSGSKSLSRVGLSEPSSQRCPPGFSGFYS